MSDSDSASESTGLNLEQDEEWQDVEEDAENVSFTSLFDDQQFSSIISMLEYCRDKHNLDVWKLRKDMQLDDLDLMKLVNYVRQEVKAGRSIVSITTKSQFEDNNYLQPILQDDAVLYSLEDAFANQERHPLPNGSDLQAEVDSLRQQLASLRTQFETYRTDIQSTLLADLSTDTSQPSSSKSVPRPLSKPITGVLPTSHHSQSLADDADYFTSYATTSIHHTMLSDTVRTSAYRDFIYSHKHLFKDRIIVDVGCGAGILSLFAAAAGARLVLAIDNSSIITTATRNFLTAGYPTTTITPIRGKIEELDLSSYLPSDVDGKVDIIVSEWMGYALLYESMLDSVIYARDKYLAPSGLMVPSHATINMAPLADSNMRIDYVDFWRDVYGFDFSCMLEGTFSDAIVRTISADDVVGVQKDAAQVVSYDLHTVSVEELKFEKDFHMRWKQGKERLEGFVLWFDMFFAESRSSSPALNIEAAKKREMTHFTTGPFGKTTHWEQVILLIEDTDDASPPSSKPAASTLGNGTSTSSAPQPGAANTLNGIEPTKSNQLHLLKDETPKSSIAQPAPAATLTSNPLMQSQLTFPLVSPIPPHPNSGLDPTPEAPQTLTTPQQTHLPSITNLTPNSIVSGTIKYKKHLERERSLRIVVEWEISGGREDESQDSRRQRQKQSWDLD